MLTTYRRKAVVRADGRIEITALSLPPGTKVDVIVRVEGEADALEVRQERQRALKTLFQQTQALPQVSTITEEEIAAEIAAYRAQQV